MSTSWPNPFLPGVPPNPEKSRDHWLDSGDGEIFAARWDANMRCWFYSGDAVPFEPNRAAKGESYVAPCLTPAEVATAIVVCIKSERETCAKLVADFDYAEENFDLYEVPKVVARDERMAAAIRARST